MNAFGAAYGFLASLLIGGGVGYYLDGRFGWSPWGIVVGSLAGFGAGLYSLQKALSKTDER